LEQQLKHRAWFESPINRLKMWRQFRHSLDTDNTLQVCETVVEWWRSAPTVSLTIDPVESTNWPTPWEMLYSGDFCDNSLALGMAYTIYYTNSSIPNELLYITNTKDSKQKLCALIDQKYLLNYEHGVISKKPGPSSMIGYRVSVDKLVKRKL